MTPHESFLATGHKDEWSKIVGSRAFGVACEYALLQLVTELPGNAAAHNLLIQYTGLDANAQRQGAQRLIEILQHLAEPVKKNEPPKRETPYSRHA